MPEKKEKLWPGEPGYKGGTFWTTVHTEKGSFRVKTIKDENGNVVAVFEEPLIFGIF